MISWIRPPTALGALVAATTAFAPGAFAQAPNVGPVDGHDLPATDPGAGGGGHGGPPLFALESYGGETIALADYRGRKNVVLVFYRGHW